MKPRRSLACQITRWSHILCYVMMKETSWGSKVNWDYFLIRRRGIRSITYKEQLIYTFHRSYRDISGKRIHHHAILVSSGSRGKHLTLCSFSRHLKTFLSSLQNYVTKSEESKHYTFFFPNSHGKLLKPDNTELKEPTLCFAPLRKLQNFTASHNTA